MKCKFFLKEDFNLHYIYNASDVPGSIEEPPYGHHLIIIEVKQIQS